MPYPGPHQTQPWHDQVERFGPANDTNSTLNLVDYACFRMALGAGANTAPARANLAQFAILPVCEFPYINKGWGIDGEPGYDDVVFDDCSITYADTIPGYK